MVRKLLDEEMAPEARHIHAGMIPGEVREGDPIGATIKSRNQSTLVRVWRYSPFGIEFINDAKLQLKKGDPIEVLVRLGKDETQFDGLVVSELYCERGMVLAGVRTFRPRVTDALVGDRRTTQRWTCADDFLPRGRAANPLVYNDFILFRIENVSSTGVRIITSMRNKLLGIGQRLDCTISLPLVGSVQTTLILKNIDTRMIGGKEELVIGAQYINPDQVFKASLAEYLLNFADGISIASLKKDNFPVKSVSEWFDFSYVKSQEEYNEVLNLRFLAYKAANKLTDDKCVGDMGDEFDARSRILIVKHKGNIVGSLRAMFHGQDDPTDHGRYVKYPPNFPRNLDVVESSRVCTHPDFRGGDLFRQLVAHTLLTAIKGGRRYIFGGAAGSLLDVYEKCGFVQVGVSYKNESLGGMEHQLILMDTHAVALGRKISIQAWNQMYSAVIDYMIEQELIVPTGIEQARINLWKSLGAMFSKFR